VTYAVLKTKQKQPSGDADPEAAALTDITRLADKFGLDVAGGVVRRSSSRFCLGVEHGDYNGTELFGVGTDR
jgi:galactokinase